MRRSIVAPVDRAGRPGAADHQTRLRLTPFTHSDKAPASDGHFLLSNIGYLLSGLIAIGLTFSINAAGIRHCGIFVTILMFVIIAVALLIAAYGVRSARAMTSLILTSPSASRPARRQASQYGAVVKAGNRRFERSEALQQQPHARARVTAAKHEHGRVTSVLGHAIAAARGRPHGQSAWRCIFPPRPRRPTESDRARSVSQRNAFRYRVPGCVGILDARGGGAHRSVRVYLQLKDARLDTLPDGGEGRGRYTDIWARQGGA